MASFVVTANFYPNQLQSTLMKVQT